MGKDAEFLDAARTGNIQVVEKVLNSKARRSGPLASLRRGPGANVQDSSGYTALHHASLNGHRSVVSLLLRHEASVNIQDDKGSTPLHLAAWAGHDHVIKVLLTQGPSIPHINHQNKGGDTALHFAAQYGHTETARFLLKKGADPTLPNLKAETPLDLAAQFGRYAIAELLLREAIDLLRPFTAHAATAAVFPHTPLHLASRNGHLGVVKLLLSHGHHVNVRTSQGSPLHEAAICGKVDVVRALMEAGADSEVKNDLGLTVLDTIAAINTPVTIEISGLIKSHHGRLIDIGDEEAFFLPTCAEVVAAAQKTPPSPSSSVNTIPSFEFALPLPLIPSPHASPPPASPPARSLPAPLPPVPSSPPFPHSSSTSIPTNPFSMRQPSSPTPSIPINQPATPSTGRPFSAPAFTFRTSVTVFRSDSLRSASSSSSSPPPSLPLSLPPSECGGVYENVLVPTRLYDTSDGDSLVRTMDRRLNSKGSSDRSGGGGRLSDRESRLSDKDAGGRLSDREGRLSDYDGRVSVASEYSSVYDVPPPPRVMTSASDRSSVSTRSSSTHEVLDDDTTYEIPPPPRMCATSLRIHKDLSDGEASKPHPPPKPPRRSICPPSPTTTDGSEDRSYEMICFATSGNHDRKSDLETFDTSKPGRGGVRTVAPAYHQSLSRPARGTRKHGPCSSDSDSDSGRPHRFNNLISNKSYTAMSFKPVKSRRTTKVQNSYENSIHRYENIHHYHSRKQQQQPPPQVLNYPAKSQSSSHLPLCNNAASTNGPSSQGSFQYPWNSPPHHRRLPTQRAKSIHGDRGLRDSDLSSEEDWDGDGRPKSLDLVLDDDIRPSRPPVSPSHFEQPPTPDHPPPSARQAQIYIQKKFRQVSQETPVQKRLSRDIETETDPEDSVGVEVRSTGVGGTPPPPEEDLPVGGDGCSEDVGRGGVGGGSSCSLSSASVASLSDRSASTDNIEEVRSDVPFAGLFRGSRSSAEWPCTTEPRSMALERPRSLTTPASAFKAFDRGCRGSFPGFSVNAGSRNSCNNNNNNHLKELGDSQKGEKGGVLSPLEENEEWARISDIMASFGGGVTRESVFVAELEQEFQQRLAGMSLSPSQQKAGLLVKQASDANGGGGEEAPLTEMPEDVGDWLRKQDLEQYEATFLSHGYDDVNFLNGLLDHSELEEMGVSDASHREKLLSAVSALPSASHPRGHGRSFNSLEEWLAAIRLPQYVKVFRKHGFGEMERVRKIWEVELSVVLEVTLQGHRKRMLASLGDRPIEPELPASLAPQELSLELSKLNMDISELKEKLFHELPPSTSRECRPPETATNTIRRGTTKRRAAPQPPPKVPRAQPSIDKGDEDVGLTPQKPSHTVDQLALRNPSQLVVGVPQTLLTEWKHHPTKLVTASVQYIAQYLGSTHVKELKGAESTMKSIDKLRRSTADGAKVPDILLAVSYLGVRFIDAVTQHLVCEHEIRNIHCACQDADDLCHFAYITKDTETQGHYCHVFRVQSRDRATEIIMTLGEAFEVAYQLSLREQQQQQLANQSDEQKLAQGHSRSKSEHVRGIRGGPLTNGSHVRSLSSVSNQYITTKGDAAPSTSLENLPSDSGNFSDRDPDAPISQRGSTSPSVDSSSHSGSTCHQQNNDAS